MMKVLLSLIFLLVFLPSTIFAAASLDKINKPLTSFGTVLHRQNQKVCDRFEEDLVRMAAIMDELKDRKGILETRVAFGGVDTAIESADYSITYAAEAVAFQRVQKYNSQESLRSSLQILAGKIIKAKNEVGKALDEE